MNFRTYVDGGADADEDGYGTAVDCDDTDAAVNPGAAEVYNQVDDNCNGTADEGFVAYYVDGDGDSFGAGPASYATSQPTGSVATPGDCDDSDSWVRPNSFREQFNEVDDNCNGMIDEGLFAVRAPRSSETRAAAPGAVRSLPPPAGRPRRTTTAHRS